VAQVLSSEFEAWAVQVAQVESAAAVADPLQAVQADWVALASALKDPSAQVKQPVEATVFWVAQLAITATQ